MTIEHDTLVGRIALAFQERHGGFPLVSHLVCLVLVGSQAHNTYVPKDDPDACDDIDVLGLVLPPERYVYGLSTFDHWTYQHGDLDITLYSLHKFVRLALKGNPNVLGLLWGRPEEYLLTTPAFTQLVEHRPLFASKDAYHSFAGYANGQMQRMVSYTPEIDAEIADLTVKLEAAGWHLQDVMDKRSVPMPTGITPDEANAMADRLRLLRARYHSAYMGEKRRALVRKHGYDAKMASHLIRLLNMAVEFMQTGNMSVYRTHDAATLRAIKRGEWTLDAVKTLAEKLFEEARAAKDASALPEHADAVGAEQLLLRICGQRFGVW